MFSIVEEYGELLEEMIILSFGINDSSLELSVSIISTHIGPSGRHLSSLNISNRILPAIEQVGSDLHAAAITYFHIIGEGGVLLSLISCITVNARVLQKHRDDKSLSSRYRNNTTNYYLVLV